MRTLLAAGVAAIATAATAAPPVPGPAAPPRATCMTTTGPEIVQGRLVATPTPTGSAYILLIPRPQCLNGPSPDDRVKRFSRIHLAPMNAAHASALARLNGRHIHVQGHAFPAHTRYHAAPVVMSISEIDAI